MFYITPPPYQASAELERFIMDAAPAHYACETAPASYAALMRWHASTQRPRNIGERISMPVYSGGCDHTIYSVPAVNHAARAWHDSVHIAEQLGFDYSSEIRVSMQQRIQARRAGMVESDLRALWCDTAGQVIYYDRRGAYVQNQSLFVAACLDIGINEASCYVY